MCMERKFFFDFSLTFLMNIYMICFLQTNDLDAGVIKYTIEKTINRILIFRIAVGFTLNILGFVAILVIYLDIVNNNTTSTELVFIATLFTFCSSVLLLLCLRSLSRFLDKRTFWSDAFKLSFIMCFKLFDIINDFLILLFVLVLSTWKITMFSLIIMTILSTDIILNVIICGVNLHDCDLYQDRLKERMGQVNFRKMPKTSKTKSLMVQDNIKIPSCSGCDFPQKVCAPFDRSSIGMEITEANKSKMFEILEDDLASVNGMSTDSSEYIGRNITLTSSSSESIPSDSGYH